MTSTLFKSAHLIDPTTNLDENGDLLVEEGVIKAVGGQIEAPAGARVIDARNRVLCPGFIDMRAHSVDLKSAAKGGITTLILQPDQTTCIDTDAAVERIRARAVSAGSVRVYPMGAATLGLKGEQLAELGQMKQSGAVAFTDCMQPVSNATMLRRLMEYAGYFGALVVQFPLAGDLHGDAIATEGEAATRLGLRAAPAIAEVIQIERDCRLAALVDAPIHFSLVTTRDGVEAIRKAKAAGLKVSAATSPAYLHFNDQALEGYRTFAKLHPPLRSESDRLAVIDGLADGTLDCLVSDHHPRSEDLKRLPFTQASAGAVGFETLLPAALSSVHAGKVSMPRLVDSLTHQPAKLLGLETGNLRVGSPADLTLFDPDAPQIVDRKALVSSAKNTPFDTMPLSGVVRACFVGGAEITEA